MVSELSTTSAFINFLAYTPGDQGGYTRTLPGHMRTAQMLAGPTEQDTLDESFSFSSDYQISRIGEKGFFRPLVRHWGRCGGFARQEYWAGIPGGPCAAFDQVSARHF